MYVHTLIHHMHAFCSFFFCVQALQVGSFGAERKCPAKPPSVSCEVVQCMCF